MNKNIIIGIIALVLVVSIGIVEIVIINNEYSDLQKHCETLIVNCVNKSVTADQYEDFIAHWKKARETSELFLPHIDVYEINLRIAEAKSNITNREYEMAQAHLSVVGQLLEYIPHMMIPNWQHIL